MSERHGKKQKDAGKPDLDRMIKYFAKKQNYIYMDKSSYVLLGGLLGGRLVNCSYNTSQYTHLVSTLETYFYYEYHS